MEKLIAILGAFGLLTYLLSRRGSTQLQIDNKGWLKGFKVTRIPAHPSWYYKTLDSKTPLGIVAHYTATKAGTGVPMAKRRVKPIQAGQREASWHVTVERDGSIIQMIPFLSGAWHVAKGNVGGFSTNKATIGIELVGDGKSFTPAQVNSAKLVWRALVKTYGINRDLAMLHHSQFDPQRRKDPGPVWVAKHQEDVLRYAFG